MKIKFLILFLISGMLILSCKKDNGDGTSTTTVNVFSVEKDMELGEQLETEINGDPTNYPILDSSKNANTQYAYQELHRIVNKILNSGKVVYKDRFKWRLKIIKDDSTLNAFCGPGGKIYVYTGLIKYLDREDHLAGVLAHEIAHADRRHITEAMTTQYGIDILLSVTLGENQGKLSEIAKNLTLLKFSRNHETDADNMSVTYLCPTTYKADGSAGFFAKLIAQQQTGSTPEFLSTHPSPENRVENITQRASSLNCGGSETGETNYQKFKDALK